MSTKHTLRAMVVLGGILMVPALAAAQSGDTSGGTLTVTATVDSSIKLTFESDAAGVALAGSGTNTATMAMGTISAHETIASTLTRTVSATDFTVSSPFGVRVVKANSTSGTYTLEAALASADTNAWRINAVALTTTDAPLGNAYAYDSAVQHTVYLTVPVTAASGAISQGIDFTATSN